jgi:ATP-binding cassette subfamily C protein
MMLAGAVLEVIGVAAIPAFVSAVVDPERLERYAFVSRSMEALDISSGPELIVAGGAALLALFTIKNLFLMLNQYAQARYVARQRSTLSRRLTLAYLDAPYIFHVRRNSSLIIRNINREVSMVTTNGISPLLELGTRSMILIFVLGFLLYVEPWITVWWIVFLGAVCGAGVVVMSARLKRYGRVEQAAGRTLMQALQQGFGGLKEMKAANRETFFADKITDAVDQMAYTVSRKQFIHGSIAPVLEIVAVAGLLTLTGWLVLAARPTDEVLVTLSLFVVGLVRLREVLAAVISHLANLRYSLVSVEPIAADLAALEGAEPPRQPAEPVTPLRFSDRIELRDLSYRYDGTDRAALENVSVMIAKGSATGFVGSTGAGKSTLVDIILGLLEPEHGGVFVDGTDIRLTGVRQWQANLGYVPQSIYILDDTIRRNIAFGVPDRDIDEVALQRAIITAQLQRFIGTLPKALDTTVGERGVRLSGGERQRIGIARALYNDPQVLIFDEATSALDNTTERAIISSIEAMKGTRTIITIAHRLSTVRNCDVLHFLANGRIEASGTYDELQDGHHGFKMMSAG